MLRFSIGDGIRQSLVNQRPEFIGAFFSTVQFIFAGNDSEGLKYGTIGTPEKFFLNWKEDEDDNEGYKLDKYLLKICDKDRLIELMHDFVLFDGGIKKLPRVHQYFSIKAAQEHVQRREGGIIWHTQGSGKSIVMVLLAKWILEDNPNARVVIVTDRDELDKQIEGVFRDAGEQVKRTSSGRDLMTQLGQASPRLLCSLVHKFGKKDVADFDAFIKELESAPSQTVGDVFVFVDECHRTQSGRLHRTMKALMSKLLDEIIETRKAKALEYEAYLKQIGELAKMVEGGQEPDTPNSIKTPGQRALYNNLGQDEELANEIDQAVKTKRPDGWRGVVAKERVVKRALYDVLENKEEVERIFLIIMRQREY